MRKRRTKLLKTIATYALSAALLFNYQTSVITHINAADNQNEPAVVMELESEPVEEVVQEEVIIEETTPVENYENFRSILKEEILANQVEEEQAYEFPISEEDIELIALVTMAEAEGESEYGKRLVIDTILNRMDHERFPGTPKEVIYQPSQFSSMWNGRVDRCYVDESICELVKEELQTRTNYDVMFFTAGDYGNYGTPMFPVGNHYFSSYT